MEKINIAELLKDCPQGMELYSPIFGNVYLDKIRPHLAIIVTTDKKQGDFKEEFLYDGRYGMNGECMLFPSKDQRDWIKFQRPFKDGDVISKGSFIAIFYKFEDHLYYRCWYNTKYNSFKAKIDFGIGYIEDYVYASKEEKQKLFDAIKANGYKWNAETKTLEKLIEKTKNSEETKFPSFEPMFKLNDEIEYKIPDGYEITEVLKDKVFIKPIKPKYPKTYAECCDVLYIVPFYNLRYQTYEHSYHKFATSNKLLSLQDKLNDLGKLLICRDAYWKIAGDWKPEFRFGKKKYCIMTKENKVISATVEETNRILIFPTEEMRDAFYENFKDLIKKYKELL